jgi:hypothetical protein
MRQVDIVRFGEHKLRDKDKWAELLSGEQIIITDFQIGLIWKRWVGSKGAKRRDNTCYNIFSFSRPEKFDI